MEIIRIKGIQLRSREIDQEIAVAHVIGDQSSTVKIDRDGAVSISRVGVQTTPRGLPEDPVRIEPVVPLKRNESTGQFWGHNGHQGGLFWGHLQISPVYQVCGDRGSSYIREAGLSRTDLFGVWNRRDTRVFQDRLPCARVRLQEFPIDPVLRCELVHRCLHHKRLRRRSDDEVS